MKATQQLKQEHESIKCILNIMEKISKDLDLGKDLNTNHYEKIINFIEGFADKCHHCKEEEILIPAMVDQGILNNSDSNAVILNLRIEHQLGRSHIKLLENAIDKLKKGNKLAISSIISSSMNYVRLVRNHIEKENHILFIMADKILNEVEQSKIVKAFEKLDLEKISTGKHNEYRHSLKELSNIYL